MDRDDSSDRVRFFSHNVQPEDLKVGDHIYVYRRGSLYQHHGIYTGTEGDSEVIHFSGPIGDRFSKDEAIIRSTTLKDFLQGGKVRLVAYNESKIKSSLKKRGTSHTERSRTAEEVVKDAMHYKETPEDWGNYHFLLHNCESFAFSCKTGEKVDSTTRVQSSLPIVRFLHPSFPTQRSYCEDADMATQQCSNDTYGTGPM